MNKNEMIMDTWNMSGIQDENFALLSSGASMQQSPMTTTSSTTSETLKFGSRVPLPEGYSPSPFSVVIGRGGHTRGRSRLRMIASKFLDRYSEAATKIEKSAIVTEIIEKVEEGCPFGAFIKFSNGRWWEVDASKAREKVGYILRDLLHDKYRSSSQSKAAARRQKSKEKKMGFSCSSVCSSSSSNASNSSASMFHAKDAKENESFAKKLQSISPTIASLIPTNSNSLDNLEEKNFDTASSNYLNNVEGNARNSTNAFAEFSNLTNDTLDLLSFSLEHDSLMLPGPPAPLTLRATTWPSFESFTNHNNINNNNNTMMSSSGGNRRSMSHLDASPIYPEPIPVRARFQQQQQHTREEPGNSGKSSSLVGMDIFEMKENPSRVPVGQELSDVFD